MQKTFFVSISISIFLWVTSAAFGATLVGRVYSGNGKPVGGIIVAVQPTVMSEAYVSNRLLTDAQGKFSIDVPDGVTYSVCAGAPQLNLLNSCEWSWPNSLIEIKSKQTSAEVTITLQTGVKLSFRLNDPSQLLPSKAVLAAASPVSVSDSKPQAVPPMVQFGVWDSNGHYHAAVEVSGDEKGRNHELLVPAGADFHFSIQATGVQILDPSGKAVDAAPPSAFKSLPSVAAQVTQYQVVAKGK